MLYLDKTIYLEDHLYYDNIRTSIVEENKEALQFSAELLSYVEEDLLVMMNKIIKREPRNNPVNEALFLLFAQAVKSTKSVLILSIEGYLTNAVMCARNTIEIILNTHYIIKDEANSERRAKKFLNRDNHWSEHKIYERAYLQLNKPLYELYKTFSNYIHSNITGVSQNFLVENNNISTIPSTEKIPSIINITNALFYTLVKDMSNQYKIESERFDSIEVNEATRRNLATFEIEREFITKELEWFKEEFGFTEEQIKEIEKDFKNYTIRGNKKKKNRHKKKKK